MKKLFSIFLIIFLMFSFVLTTNAANKKKKKKKTKDKIEFLSKDKFVLVGDLYLPAENSSKPLVILVHSYLMNSLYWSDLAEKLRLKGYNVLAVDIRGHGRSVHTEKLKYRSCYNFKNDDWKKIPSDIIDSINYIKNTYSKINTNNIILVGADLGANASVLASNMMKVPPSKLILISPMYQFKGLKMPIKTRRLVNCKIMILLSKTNKMVFNFTTNTPTVTKQYSVGGPGMKLIKVNPSATNDIINFIMH